MSSARVYIAVVGSGQCDGSVARAAHEVGRLIAESGAVLICGGLSGVMDAAAEGAKEAGGLTVGILPSHNRAGASRHLDIALPSGIGEARNALIVRAADALIAVGGEYGTLSEIAFGLKTGKPVIGLNTWELRKNGRKDDGIIEAETPEEAVKKALKAVTVV